jgi:hypothetical protein
MEFRLASSHLKDLNGEWGVDETGSSARDVALY